MKRTLLTIFLLFLLGCTEGVDFSFSPPKIETLALNEGCDHNLKSGACLIYKKEVFEITKTLPVDILFIVDTSLSMEPVLTKIGNGFSSLMKEIEDFDWRMAFTTADHGDHNFYCEEDQWSEDQNYCAEGFKREFPEESDRWQDYEDHGHLPHFGRFMHLQNPTDVLTDRILSPHLRNYDQIFYHTLSRHFDYEKEDICQYPPYCQQGNNEQPLRVLKSILAQAHLTHKDFFRKDVGLVVFIVTNEEERSEDSSRATTADDVLKEFSTVFENEDKNKKLLVYGISVQDDECLKKQEQESGNASGDATITYSHALSELVQKTGGSSTSICLDDYKQAFEDISSNIYSEIKSLPLQFKPVVQVDEDIQINVAVTGPEKIKQLIQFGGEVLGKNIYFSDNLKPGSRIEVKYYYNATDEPAPHDEPYEKISIEQYN